jgi:HEAT repeat protein
MKGSRKTKAALEELAANLERAERVTAANTLRSALASKSNLLVQKAAGLAGKLKAEELVPDLSTAFRRFTGDGMRADRFCVAKTAIVNALRQLGRDQPEIFLVGMKCYWPARPRTGQRDEAVPLRIASATAHAELGRQSELEPFVDLLVDPVSDVRHAAVRSLVALGGQQGVLILRLKVLSGDDNPSVIDECFTGLLEADGDRSLPFVASFLDAADSHLRISAAVAIGESGHKLALDTLVSRWKRAADPEFSRDLLVAIAILRSEPATQFLLSLVESGGPGAADALVALAAYRSNPKLRCRVEEAVARASRTELQELFEYKFPRLQAAD